MLKEGKFNIINKLIIVICFFVFSSMNAFAAENALLGIIVKQAQNNSYDVLLKLDKNVRVIKTPDGSDNLTLTLNSTRPSDSMEIIYDNAAGLKNVIVQKKNSDNTVILLQGKNIIDSKIYTKDLSNGTIRQSNITNNLFFVSDGKCLISLLIIGLLFFAFISNFRPKRHNKKLYNKNIKIKKQHNSVNTLRNKNLMQSRNIPSINYKVNGSFQTVNAYISRPNDFNTSQYINDSEEKIRKAG